MCAQLVDGRLGPQQRLELAGAFGAERHANALHGGWR
jgi:hypothetical protein